MRAAFLHFMKIYTDFSAKQLFTCISVRQESAFHWIKAVRNGNKDLYGKNSLPGNKKTLVTVVSEVVMGYSPSQFPSGETEVPCHRET